MQWKVHTWIHPAEINCCVHGASMREDSTTKCRTTGGPSAGKMKTRCILNPDFICSIKKTSNIIYRKMMNLYKWFSLFLQKSKELLNNFVCSACSLKALSKVQVLCLARHPITLTKTKSERGCSTINCKWNSKAQLCSRIQKDWMCLYGADPRVESPATPDLHAVLQYTRILCGLNHISVTDSHIQTVFDSCQTAS